MGGVGYSVSAAGSGRRANHHGRRHRAHSGDDAKSPSSFNNPPCFLGREGGVRVPVGEGEAIDRSIGRPAVGKKGSLAPVVPSAVPVTRSKKDSSKDADPGAGHLGAALHAAAGAGAPDGAPRRRAAADLPRRRLPPGAAAHDRAALEPPRPPRLRHRHALISVSLPSPASLRVYPFPAALFFLEQKRALFCCKFQFLMSVQTPIFLLLLFCEPCKSSLRSM